MLEELALWRRPEVFLIKDSGRVARWRPQGLLSSRMKPQTLHHQKPFPQTEFFNVQRSVGKVIYLLPPRVNRWARPIRKLFGDRAYLFVRHYRGPINFWWGFPSEQYLVAIDHPSGYREYDGPHKRFSANQVFCIVPRGSETVFVIISCFNRDKPGRGLLLVWPVIIKLFDERCALFHSLCSHFSSESLFASKTPRSHFWTHRAT